MENSAAGRTRNHAAAIAVAPKLSRHAALRYGSYSRHGEKRRGEPAVDPHQWQAAGPRWISLRRVEWGSLARHSGQVPSVRHAQGGEIRAIDAELVGDPVNLA